jgi:hypothetical protein
MSAPRPAPRTMVPLADMRRRWVLLVMAALAPAGCGRRSVLVVETPDAAPVFLPDHLKKEVEQTLEKEHERTLDPRVE